MKLRDLAHGVAMVAVLTWSEMFPPRPAPIGAYVNVWTSTLDAMIGPRPCPAVHPARQVQCRRAAHDGGLHWWGSADARISDLYWSDTDADWMARHLAYTRD